MARKLLPDDLWAEIAPLTPSAAPHRKDGRRPIEARKALLDILIVLYTGLPWERLPYEVAGCSVGKTADDERAVLRRRLGRRAAAAVSFLSPVARGPAWIAIVVSAIEGFELRLVRMLKGRRLGRIHEVFDGYDAVASLDALPSRFEKRRPLILFPGDGQTTTMSSNGT